MTSDPSEGRETTHEPRVLLLGATSLLGYTLTRRYPNEVSPLTNPHNRSAAAEWHRARLDRPSEWLPLLDRLKPELVIHAHAVCNVSKCERNPAWARRLNIDSLVALCEHLPASSRLVYVSSDHVFGGDGRYSEKNEPTPISVYGHTRVAAERLVLQRPGALVVRPGLAIGRSLDGRSGFQDWLRYRHEQRLPLTVIADEARSAVWVDDLAERVLQLARSEIVGVRHVTSTRMVGRPELATYLMTRQGLPPEFTIRLRADQSYPHLGKVELATEFDDEVGAPLASVLDEVPPQL